MTTELVGLSQAWTKALHLEMARDRSGGLAAPALAMASRLRLSCFLTVIASLSAVRPCAAVELDHRPVACVLADANPRIVTRATPDEDVARIRLYFRSDEKGGYYSLGATRIGEGLFATVLPQPRAGSDGFEYYVEAFDVSFESRKTPVARVRVVRAAGECQGPVAETAPPAELVLSVPAGRRVGKVPAGFSGAGVVKAGEEHVGMFNLSSGHALLAGAGVLGAGVAASLASSNRPPAVNPDAQGEVYPVVLALTSTFPRIGSDLAVSSPTFTASVAITSPVPLPAPVVRFDFYRDAAGASELCATLERTSSRVNQKQPSSLFATGPLTFTGACGQPPYPMRQVRITVRDGGEVVLATGGQFPDEPVNYNVVP